MTFEIPLNKSFYDYNGLLGGGSKLSDYVFRKSKKYLEEDQLDKNTSFHVIMNWYGNEYKTHIPFGTSTPIKIRVYEIQKPLKEKLNRDQYLELINEQKNAFLILEFNEELSEQRNMPYFSLKFESKVEEKIKSISNTAKKSKATKIRNMVFGEYPIFKKIENALNRKKQVIFYGPPGTGKTYYARLFSIFFLMINTKNEDKIIDVFNQDQFLTMENELKDNDRLQLVTFHPSYSYEEFVEGIKPTKSDDDQIKLDFADGLFFELCDKARNSEFKHLLIIDEINRAHLAKVFGELITLLETDKRGVKVTLPYSKRNFSIPDNLYIIGTMNTADFSVKSLDVALRRRFSFLEFHPQYEILDLPITDSFHLGDFLENLNIKITNSFGREKQIGHALFMEGGKPITTPEEFQEIFNQDVIRLLEEYCHSDYNELTSFVGDKIVNQNNQRLNYQIIDDADLLIQSLEEFYSDEE